MGRYIFSHKAVADLTDIYRYTSKKYGATQADLYAGSLKKTCQMLADYPLMNRERSEFTPPVHLHHHRKHLIIYAVKADHIVIIRLLHDRMDIQRQLDGPRGDQQGF